MLIRLVVGINHLLCSLSCEVVVQHSHASNNSVTSPPCASLCNFC